MPGFITPAQYTLAQTMVRGAKAVSTKKRRKKAVKKAVSGVKKKAVSVAKRGVKKLVKGSAAAKAWGAKMKRLRKK